MAGRQVTGASSRPPAPRLEAVAGSVVDSVESQGKNLLINFSCGLTLRTHLQMTGSWHVYPAGEPWRRPGRQACAVIRAGDRVAVCFNAPIVELFETRTVALRPALAALGPDLLDEGPFPLPEIRARARRRSPASPTVGELLLDQRVAAGVGNIYRCETLFLCATSPFFPSALLGDGAIDELWSTAARLLRANAAGSPVSRNFEGAPRQAWVYRRAGLPCRRCGTTVRRAEHGRVVRVVFWCPTCQPSPPRGPLKAT
jgi:endonuclease-8